MTTKSYIVTKDKAQTLTNKTINADSNVITNIDTADMKSDAISISIPSTGAVDTKLATEKAVADTVVSAGTGLSKSGTTFNHSNSVTAETSGKLGMLKYDAQGHVTGLTERPIVTSWSATTLDTNIPSEKLVKNALDNSEEWTITFTDGTTVTRNVLLKQ